VPPNPIVTLPSSATITGTARRPSLWESIRCVRLALWDDAERRLVSFREARRRA